MSEELALTQPLANPSPTGDAGPPVSRRSQVRRRDGRAGRSSRPADRASRLLDGFGASAAQPQRTERASAVALRNEAWAGLDSIPPWVNPESVDLDRFFTRPEIAQLCYQSLADFLEDDGALSDDFVFIDPSSGNGAFFNLMPAERRLAIDVLPNHTGAIQADYLSWFPTETDAGYVVVGNPPFGYRAWLALAFMNHSAVFADYIGMILPMAFQSDGKGSPKHRVQGAELLISEILPSDAFTDEQGQTVKVNALWQIWKRGVNRQIQDSTCEQWVDLFTVDLRPERLCGQERMGEAQWFLQRTYFGNSPTLVRNFSEVRYGCGYGIVIKKEEHAEAITEILQNTNWTQYSNLAAHNCRHISMYHIRRALTDAGYVD